MTLEKEPSSTVRSAASSYEAIHGTRSPSKRSSP